MVAAGMAVAGSLQLTSAVTTLCSVRKKSPGKVTTFLRENNIGDAVEAAVLRKKMKAKKMQKKARTQANKMGDFDVAQETVLAPTVAALNAEIATYRKAKIAVRTYLQEQYKSRRLLRNGKHNTIPSTSEFRQTVKPYALRMYPFPNEGGKITTDMQITYLTKLLHLMINEDLLRPFEPTARPEEQKLVRRLPVLSEQHINPESVRLKQLQESTVAAMASPKDNPWIARLQEEYMGKILYDGGYYRVFMIHLTLQRQKCLPCWEATTEPVYKDDNGAFVVHPRHLLQSVEGAPKLLKSAEVGFALAEYSNGDHVDPVLLPFAAECHTEFLAREARQASALACQRRQPATAHTTQPATASPRKRRTPATHKAAAAPERRSRRSRRN